MSDLSTLVQSMAADGWVFYDYGSMWGHETPGLRLLGGDGGIYASIAFNRDLGVSVIAKTSELVTISKECGLSEGLRLIPWADIDSVIRFMRLANEWLASHD